MTNAVKDIHANFLLELFSAFDARSIRYCIVRNFESLPQSIDDDIDILIDKSDLLQIEPIIRGLLSSTFVIIKTVRRNYHLQVYITSIIAIRYAISEVKPVESIELDFVTDLQWRGIPYISTVSALKNRQQYRCFYILNDDDHISHLICHAILDKSQFSDKYWNTVSQYFFDINQKCPESLLLFLGLSLGEQIADAGRRRDPDAALAIRTRLIRRVLTRPVHLAQNVSYTLSKCIRIMRAIFNPPGVLLTAVGPDGVGKTTLLLRVGQTLASCFSSVEEVYMGWKDFVLPTKRLLRWMRRRTRKFSGGRRVGYGRPESAKQSVDDDPSWTHNLSVIHYFLDLYARYFIRILPSLARNSLVLCDRYFYDIFWQKLYLTNGSFFRKMLVKVSPLPTLTVIFSGDPNVIAARKCEVSANETAEQIEAYRTLLDLNEQALELDALASLEDNTLSVIERLLSFSNAGRSS